MRALYPLFLFVYAPVVLGDISYNTTVAQDLSNSVSIVHLTKVDIQEAEVDHQDLVIIRGEIQALWKKDDVVIPGKISIVSPREKLGSRGAPKELLLYLTEWREPSMMDKELSLQGVFSSLFGEGEYFAIPLRISLDPKTLNDEIKRVKTAGFTQHFKGGGGCVKSKKVLVE